MTRGCQWKKPSMKVNLIRKRPQWKSTLTKEDLKKDDHIGRGPQKNDHKGRESQRKMTSTEDGLNGKQPQLKTPWK